MTYRDHKGVVEYLWLSIERFKLSAVPQDNCAGHVNMVRH